MISRRIPTGLARSTGASQTPGPLTRRALFRVTGLAGTAALLAACGAETSSGDDGTTASGTTGSGPGTTTPAPVEQSGGDLRLLLITDTSRPTGYDTAQSQEQTVGIVSDTVYDTLLELDPSGELQPSIATEWTVSDDLLTYTFTLRDDVVFHNDAKLEAKDVVYTLGRFKDPNVTAPRGRLLANISSVEATDATTLVITLARPQTTILSTLAHISTGIIPEGSAEGTDFGNSPIGSGPFVFTEWVRDQRLTVTANKKYWRTGQPKLDSITFSFNSDDSARSAALRAGDIDFLYQPSTTTVDLLSSNSDYQVFGQNNYSWHYMVMSPLFEPFKDVRVRQAIFSALDRDALAIAGLGEGHAAPLAGGFLPASDPAAVTEPVWTQDYDKAKQLLADAGYADGFDLEIVTLTGWDWQNRTMQVIAEQLKPLGIKATVRIIESAMLNSAAASGEYEAMGWSFSPTFSADERIQQVFVTDAPANYGKWSNTEFDDLIQQARETTDMDQSAALTNQALELVTEEGAWAFLYNYNIYDVLNSNVHNYVANPRFSYRTLREVTVDA